jgi:hypothetical protein
MKDSRSGIKPYKGLAPYSVEDAPFFFGRDVESEIIIANLIASRLTLLYGQSGVGKSSVLRAGVLSHLRQQSLDSLNQGSGPELAIVVYSSWRDDPLVGLINSIHTLVASGMISQEPPKLASSRSFIDVVQNTTKDAKIELFIILDQFEEYFLYHGQEDGEGTFAVEFPRAVNHPGLRVNFLVAIREDALAKLDRFKGRIPNLFDNYLRLEHLDRSAAHSAIVGPINRYNHLEVAHENSVSIETQLIDAVLEQVRTGELTLGRIGGGVVEDKNAPVQIETPFLQLVMTRLWDEEIRRGSQRLRLETLRRLGGAKQIVQTHLDSAMSDLPQNDRGIASRIFHYLVTPSGTKIAHTARDLADYTNISEDEIASILERLSGGEARILRSVTEPLNQSPIQRYEIFHDVLVPAILNWRRRHAQRQRRSIIRNILLMGFFVLLSLIGGLGYLSWNSFTALERDSATRHETEMNHARIIRRISETVGKIRSETSTLMGNESNIIRFAARKQLNAYKAGMDELIKVAHTTIIADTPEWNEFEAAFQAYWKIINQDNPVDWYKERERLTQAVDGLDSFVSREREENDKRGQDLSKATRLRIISATTIVMSVGLIVAALAFFEIRRALSQSA